METRHKPESQHRPESQRAGRSANKRRKSGTSRKASAGRKASAWDGKPVWAGAQTSNGNPAQAGERMRQPAHAAPVATACDPKQRSLPFGERRGPLLHRGQGSLFVSMRASLAHIRFRAGCGSIAPLPTAKAVLHLVQRPCLGPTRLALPHAPTPVGTAVHSRAFTCCGSCGASARTHLLWELRRIRSHSPAVGATAHPLVSAPRRRELRASTPIRPMGNAACLRASVSRMSCGASSRTCAMPAHPAPYFSASATSSSRVRRAQSAAR